MVPVENVEKIEFARTIEGTFQKGLGADLDAALKAKFKKTGLDFDKPLLPGYPAEDFHRWLQVAAEHVYPNLSVSEGVRMIGRRSVPGLEDTLIGRALSSGLKLIGPRRSMERVGRIFRNNSNYQDVTVASMTATGGRLVVGYTFGMGSFYQGVFEQALPIIGAKNPKVELVAAPPPKSFYDITWD